MVDDLMRVLGIKAGVGLQRIGVKLGTEFNVVANFFLKVMFSRVLNHRESNLARLAFQQSEHNGFAHSTRTCDLARAFATVHVAGLASDESFVGLNSPGHFVDCAVMLRVANAMEHEPCSLLGHAKRAGDLVRRYAVLAIREHPHRTEPLVETDGGIFKYRPDFNRELFAATEARPHQTGLEKRQLLTLASRALWTIGPLSFGNSFEARQWVGKVPYGIQQTTLIIEVNRFHDPSIPLESM